MKTMLNFQNAVLLLFIASLASLVFSVLNYKTSNILSEADAVIEKLTNGNDDLSLLSSNQIDVEKVKMLDEMNYDAAKEMLGVKSDFCVYFEDEDGNLIKIDGLDYGIGSSDIHINGQPCS